MKNLHKPVGAIALSLFVATGVAFLSQPVILAHAESATSDVNLNIGAVMSISLDADSLSLNTTPHHFVSGVINATVSTNSQYGYTLTLEDVDANTNLVHTDNAVSDTLVSDFSGSKTSSEMEDNTWGFSLNATDFYKVPVNGSPVALKRTTDPMTAATETVPVTFGAMVGNIVSGAYTDGVLFTMYTNGADGKPSDGTDPGDPGDEEPIATTMQDFSCSRLNVNDTATLTDTRDGNEYTVKKLIDNKCWMMDNLRIVNKTITSDDSNLPSGETFTIPASSISGFSTDNANNAYYDETYGGFYTLYTATAGWGRRESSAPVGDSPKDICPKGWRLPTGGVNADSDFSYLSHAYNNNAGEFKAALNPIYSGEVINGSHSGKGDYGIYRTSTIKTQFGSRYIVLMMVGSWNTVDGYETYKTYEGDSIRCVTK